VQREQNSRYASHNGLIKGAGCAGDSSAAGQNQQVRRVRWLGPRVLVCEGFPCHGVTLPAELRCGKRLEIVRAATHLFEESGTLEEVARLPAEWFRARTAVPIDQPTRGSVQSARIAGKPVTVAGKAELQRVDRKS
jgi:hypothetical protein